MVQWLARLTGTQEIRGSSPGRGMTDFCTSYVIQIYKMAFFSRMDLFLTITGQN